MYKRQIEEYVQRNHDAQKATLDAYGISLSIYEGSGMGQDVYKRQGLGRPGAHVPQPAAHVLGVRGERAAHEHDGGERAAACRCV